jgi:cytochrome bd-type quinol oxidase subunit 2
MPDLVAARSQILRGAGFAFRKAVTGVALERLFGATFAASSVITPFFLGTVAVLLSLAIGAVLVVPALVALYAVAQRESAPD